jgi:hypothetical protein
MKTIREKSEGAVVLLDDPCSFDSHFGQCTKLDPVFVGLNFSHMASTQPFQHMWDMHICVCGGTIILYV